MSEVVVFRFETCPNCDRLEELLREAGIVKVDQEGVCDSGYFVVSLEELI